MVPSSAVAPSSLHTTDPPSRHDDWAPRPELASQLTPLQSWRPAGKGGQAKAPQAALLRPRGKHGSFCASARTGPCSLQGPVAGGRRGVSVTGSGRPRLLPGWGGHCPGATPHSLGLFGEQQLCQLQAGPARCDAVATKRPQRGTASPSKCHCPAGPLPQSLPWRASRHLSQMTT